MTPTNPPPSPDGAKHTPTPWRTRQFLDERYMEGQLRREGVDIEAHPDVNDGLAVATLHGPKAKANAAFIVEACNAHDSLSASLSRLEKQLADMDREADQLLKERDEAEEAADKLASAILGEFIDWPDHGAKWQEAHEEAVSLSRLEKENQILREALEYALSEIDRAHKVGVTGQWCPDWMAAKRARAALSKASGGKA